MKKITLIIAMLFIASFVKAQTVTNRTSCAFLLRVHCMTEGNCDVSSVVGGVSVTIGPGATVPFPSVTCEPTPPPFSLPTYPVYELSYVSPKPDCTFSKFTFSPTCTGYTYGIYSPCCGDPSKGMNIRYTAAGIEIWQ